MTRFDLSAQSGEITIRPLSAADYEVWFTGFENRGPSQNPYDDGKMDMSICSPEWFEGLVAKHQEFALADKQYIFGVFNESGEHLGMLDVVTLERGSFQWCEIGYLIHNQFWRRGYAYHALQALLKLLDTELNFHRVEAHVSDGNEPSMGLLKKLGFTYEGVRKNFIYEGDAWVDKHIYSLNLNEREPN
ncbi:GNAT family N-acetyltransferase [Boudabousia liubingyangii]|uniref:GNAT family N-acetyltransferase n=1 Tax=Boudabousia liubingyangii TaxID=1921764 RepID=UPI000938E33D|nr:GNAT family protein [Boudabousia liubingyangii]OKL48224.1 GNAT family N-acetyltransferase [Boudabousia liubingyangii]